MVSTDDKGDGKGETNKRRDVESYTIDEEYSLFLRTLPIVIPI